LKDTSLTAMTRRPKPCRRHRRFSLEELLTGAASGRPGETAPEFSDEIRNGCGETAVSETSWADKRCNDNPEPHHQKRQ